jgi:mRNA-degrading endonuclease toxin of MazEF toxin-antitoxin module
VIPIFSAGRLGPTRVVLRAGVGGLRRSSVLFCEEITTIDREFIARGPLGSRLKPGVLKQVLVAVRRALGEVVPGEPMDFV